VLGGFDGSKKNDVYRIQLCPVKPEAFIAPQIKAELAEEEHVNQYDN